MHSQLSSAQTIAQQRIAAQCSAVRYRALPCGAVLFHAALYFLSDIQ